MIPTAGFLAQVNNTNQPPEAAPLPEVDEVFYGDGSQNTYEDIVGAVPAFPIILLTLGSYTLISEFGFDTFGEFGFKVRMRRSDAYGFTMLDYLDPPALEQFVVITGGL